MTRREALVRLMTLFGGTIFGADRLLASTATGPGQREDEKRPVAKPVGLSDADRALLADVAETIVPATPDSGGAKDANVVAFIEEIARDYYDDTERALLLSAPAFFNAASAERHPGRGFAALSEAERFELLLAMDRRVPQPDPYRMVKQLALWGFWTSEVAAKQALTYLPVPGAYRGCVDIAPDAKALF